MKLREAQRIGLVPSGSRPLCAVCRKPGHNQRTCQFRWAIPIVRMTLAEVRAAGAR